MGAVPAPRVLRFALPNPSKWFSGSDGFFRCTHVPGHRGRQAQGPATDLGVAATRLSARAASCTPGRVCLPLGGCWAPPGPRLQGAAQKLCPGRSWGREGLVSSPSEVTAFHCLMLQCLKNRCFIYSVHRLLASRVGWGGEGAAPLPPSGRKLESRLLKTRKQTLLIKGTLI